jgi:uncharacterized coiled-coil DUF342 family protein
MALQDEKALIKQIEKLSQQTKLYTAFHAYQAQTDEMKKNLTALREGLKKKEAAISELHHAVDR